MYFLSEFDIITSGAHQYFTGQATSPNVVSFTLTTVGEKRAAMFGGFTQSSDYSNDLYIVDLKRHSVVSV